MKTFNVVTTCAFSLLLGVGAFALPTNETSEWSGLTVQSTQKCKIITSSGGKVNCRAGPSSKTRSVDKFSTGASKTFTCYLLGECVDGNWYVSITT